MLSNAESKTELDKNGTDGHLNLYSERFPIERRACIGHVGAIFSEVVTYHEKI